MPEARRLKWLVVASLLVCVAVVAHPSSGAALPAGTVTYHDPIAYIGVDGNVYVTDLTSTTSTALTTDGNITPQERFYYSSLFRYGGIHWSPDGSLLSFEDTVDHKLYVARSRQGAQPIPGVTTANTRWQSAISPDNSQVAFIVNEGDLVTIPINGGSITQVGSIGYSNTEKPDADLAEILRANEQGSSTFNSPDLIEWTKFGIFNLVTTARAQMVDTQSNVLWTIEYDYMHPSVPVLAADGTRALVEKVFPDDGIAQGALQAAVVSFSNGHMTALHIAPSGQLLAWSPDHKSVFYGTKSDTVSVHDPEFSSFDFTESTLSLWQVPLAGGETKLIFRNMGYDFGVAHVTPDNKAIVFSLVTSSVNKVQAKLRNEYPALQAEIESAHPEIIELPLKAGAAPIWIALGGNLDIGQGDFVVPMIAPQTSQPSACKRGGPTRLQVGSRANVLTRINLISRRLDYESSYYDVMNVNAGATVLVTARRQLG